MAVVSERFRGLALSIARARSAPDFPIIVLPANIEEVSDTELRALAERTFPQLLSKIMTPNTPVPKP